MTNKKIVKIKVNPAFAHEKHIESEIRGVIIKETQKAILVEEYEESSGYPSKEFINELDNLLGKPEIWLPKSQIESIEEE